MLYPRRMPFWIFISVIYVINLNIVTNDNESKGLRVKPDVRGRNKEIDCKGSATTGGVGYA